MKLPKSSDFEYANLIEKRLGRLESALGNLNVKYQEVISVPMQSTARTELELIARMRELEKSVQETRSRSSKANKNAYKPLESSCESLGATIDQSRKKLDQLMDKLHKIDTKLPESDKLTANRSQYPNLHNLLREKQILQPHSVEAQKAEVEVDETPATVRPLRHAHSARELLKRTTTH